MNPLGDGRHRGWMTVLVGHWALGPGLAWIAIGLVFQDWPLQPTARVGRHRDPRGQAPTGLPGLQKIWTGAVETIGHDLLKWQEPGWGELTDHRAGQLRLRLQGQLLRDLAPGSSQGVGVAQPRLRHEEPGIDQRIASVGGLGRPHAHLAVVDVASGATVWPGDPDRVRTLLGTPARIDHHHAIGSTHVVITQLMGEAAPLVGVPDVIAAAAWHAPDIAPVDLEGHRLERLALERAELPNHLAQERLTRFTAPEAVAEGVVNAPPFVQAAFDIAACKRTWWKRLPLPCCPICR